jgi:hypothetical protein
LPWNQGSNYALVRALADGTARIDRYTWQTGDLSYFHGHYYSVRAPGLSFLDLPLYEAARAGGVSTQGPATGQRRADGALRMIWILGLLGATLPVVVLLVLVREMSDSFVPDTGIGVAVVLGTATLLLPFASMLFVHSLSALLGFVAFAVLFAERRTRPRMRLVLVAGAIAGLAVSVEYPLAIVAALLGVYAVVRRPVLQRALAYAAGGAVGLAPLLLYNSWAFGSPLHLSYVDAVAIQGKSGHDVLGLNRTGVFGVTLPKVHVAIELLFSNRGLLTLSPILALSLYGVIRLFRTGWRSEAVTIAAIAVAYLLYDAGYENPFGGDVPGPRLLIPVLPFLALALAPAAARLRGVALGLTVASSVMMVVAVAGHPLLNGDDTGVWAHRLKTGDLQPTVLTWLGAGHRWFAFLPVATALAVAVLLPYARSEPLSVRELTSGLAATGGWLAIATLLPITVMAGHPRDLARIPLLAAAAALASAVLVACAVRRRPQQTCAVPRDTRRARDPTLLA